MTARTRLPALIAVVACFGALPATASAATIHTDSASEFGDCTLRDAVQSIREGMIDLSDCEPSGTFGVNDKIILGGGEFHVGLSGPDDDANDTGDLDINKSLTIVGLGPDRTSINGGPGYRALDVSGSGVTLTLKDLAVRNGAPDSLGGGIRGQGGTVVNVINGVISGNAAGGGTGGGGINAPTVNITNSRVSNNTAPLLGSGIGANTLTIANSTIANNSGVNALAAINATITNSTIRENSTPGVGAALVPDSAGGTFTITRSAITANHAGGAGGAIYIPSSDATTVNVTDSTLAGNVSAGGGGGAINSQGGNVTLDRTALIGNIASGSASPGGAVSFQSNGTLTATNTTFSGNRSDQDGGAIYIDGGAPTGGAANLRSATISQNVANADSSGSATGGGLARYNAPVVSLRNSIIADNLVLFSGTGADCRAVGGGLTSEGYNLFGTADTCATSGVTTGDVVVLDVSFPDSGLLALNTNGGPTLTHALTPASPAVDSAFPGTGPGQPCEPVDERGVPRSLGGRCDRGAYERVTCHGRVVNVVGTSAADVLSGTSAADGVLGLGGADRITGGSGDDGLCGGAGGDKLNGGAGKDFLDGGSGKDSCSGGAGHDNAKSCEKETSIP